MLSNHYPLAFATENAWIIAALVFLIGVSIRHYFNSRHAGTGNPTWTWAVTVVLFIILAWLSTAPLYRDDAPEDQAMTAMARQFAAADGFGTVHQTVVGRCSMCHARDPVWPGIRWAPKGVVLETEADVAGEARRIFLQSGVTHAMPPGNITNLDEDGRRAIRDWYRGATGGA